MQADIKGSFVGYLDDAGKIVEAHMFTYGFDDWDQRLEFIKGCGDAEGKYKDVTM
jgi:hypothetical protein